MLAELPVCLRLATEDDFHEYLFQEFLIEMTFIAQSEIQILREAVSLEVALLEAGAALEYYAPPPGGRPSAGARTAFRTAPVSRQTIDQKQFVTRRAFTQALQPFFGSSFTPVRRSVLFLSAAALSEQQKQPDSGGTGDFKC